MAALVVTTPSLVLMSSVVVRMVKVVPRLVALNAAPAANAWSGVADNSRKSTKDSAIGAPIPVRATQADTTRFALNDENDVDSPPGVWQCQQKALLLWIRGLS